MHRVSRSVPVVVAALLAGAMFGLLVFVDPAPPDPPSADGGTMPPEPAVALGFVPLAASLLAERPDGAVDAVAYTLRLEPGGHIDVPAGGRPESATLEYVLAGSYAVRSEGPLSVLRGGATGSNMSGEEVPPGQEVTVVQGEAVLRLEGDAPMTVRNPGDVETLVFGAGVFARTEPATPVWGVATVDAAVEVVGSQDLEGVDGQVRVLLARWDLEPGEALVPTVGPWPELAWAEAPFDPTSRSNPGTEPIEVLTASFHGAD